MSGDRTFTPLVALWIALFSSAGAGVLSAWLYGVGGPLLMLVYLLPAVLTAAAQLGWSSATYPGNDERFTNNTASVSCGAMWLLLAIVYAYDWGRDQAWSNDEEE